MYETKCENGTCKSKLKIAPHRSYKIPGESVCAAFAERVKDSPHAEYRGLGLAVKSRQVNEKDRTVLFTASTEATDRVGDVIVQDGWQLDNYLKNPIGLFAHDSTSLPIAKGIRTEVVNGELVWLAQFATKDQYPFADTVFQLVAGGFLNAVSVGFMPLEFEFLEDDGASPFPGIKFTKTELLEISIVPVPANPEALIFGKGLEAEALKLGARIQVQTPFEHWLDRLAGTESKTALESLIDACRRHPCG